MHAALNNVKSTISSTNFSQETGTDAKAMRRRLAQHWVNNIWAKVSTSLFYRTEVLLQ